MGAEPGSLRRESGMFSVLQRLANASGHDPSEVEEVAGYYRAEVAGYQRGHASLQSFVTRYQEIRMRGRAGPPKGRRERDRERFAATQAELARRFGT